MQKTAQNKLGWARLLDSFLDKYYCVVGFVCSKQQATREDVSVESVAVA